MVVEVAGFEFARDGVGEDHRTGGAADELQIGFAEDGRGLGAIADWTAALEKFGCAHPGLFLLQTGAWSQSFRGVA
jgi:hypothetical protein